VTSPPTARAASTRPGADPGAANSALKFCSEFVDVREHNQRIAVISQETARQFLAIGGYAAVGRTTIKYLRRVAAPQGPIDGPKRNAVPMASDNFTITQRGNEHAPRFSIYSHPYSPEMVSVSRSRSAIR
jgi:hypothetical protein